MRSGKLPQRVLGLLLMLSCGCMSSYRYSVRVRNYPRTSMEFGCFSVRSCDIANEQAFPMNLVRTDKLGMALGESARSRSECLPITIRLRAGKSISSGDSPFSVTLNRLSFGVFPATAENTTDIQVSVLENGRQNHEHDFTIQLEERVRFTPIGLWPFLTKNYKNECYSVAVCPGRSNEEAIAAFNLVLGWGLLSGLTAEFKEGTKR